MNPPITLSTRLIDLQKSGIAGIGPAIAKKLAAATASFFSKTSYELSTVEDLLNYLPARYEDRSNFSTIADLRDGAETSLELWTRISGGYQVGKNRGAHQPSLYIFEITASDPQNTGRPVVIWWFISGRNAKDIIAWQRKRFERGTRFIAFGKWEWDTRKNTFTLKLNKGDELELIAAGSSQQLAIPSSEVDAPPVPEDEIEDEYEDPATLDPKLAAIHVGRIVPIYRKLGDVRPKLLRELMFRILSSLSDESIPETLPVDLLKRQQLISRNTALRSIHFPPESSDLVECQNCRSFAHRRLIFEEFFWLALAMALRRSESAKEKKGAIIEPTDRMRQRISGVTPFQLTGAQTRAIDEIFRDMQSDSPMSRLLQGDVGSGKTIVAVQAMLAAMENGYQAALMAPTEILAEQHSRNIKRILARTPYRVELLTSSTRTADKRSTLKALETGEISAMIGTHALIQEGVRFKSLGLAVIDEQHRFGVLQRAELRARGINPDVLIMTATPIPRSLAMTAYGDLNVSVIDELPPGRTPIKTVVCGEDQRRGVYKGLEREIRNGRQAYVVYPLIEESEVMDLKDATRMFEHLRDRVFPHFTINLLHGRMTASEKDDCMRGFVSGRTQILVSTTVIEVGVDVSNASVMVIEHAERFGLSQLHQLRGRVGRGSDQSYCVLLASEKQTLIAKQRLGIMEETSDGFRIAEKDLELRGPGEVLGTRQAGLPSFRIGNLVRDQKILEAAKIEADAYVSSKNRTKEAKSLITTVKADPRYGLGKIG